MTTQQTTYRFGALGNSGDKSAEERGFPSGKGRKKLFLAEIAFIGPFGTKRHGVRVSALQPKRPKAEFILRFRSFFYIYLGVLPPLFEKSYFPDHIIKYGLKIPFSLFAAVQKLSHVLSGSWLGFVVKDRQNRNLLTCRHKINLLIVKADLSHRDFSIFRFYEVS